MSTTIIRPVNDRIACIREEAKTQQGGIIIPETVQEKPQRCTVIAVGPGKLMESGVFHPLMVKEGDTVLLNGRWAGFEAEVNIEGEDKKVIFVREDQILAVLETA